MISMGFSRLNMAKIRSDKLGARNHPSLNAKGKRVEIKTVLMNCRKISNGPRYIRLLNQEKKTC